MAAEKFVVTAHPEPKKPGSRIEKAKYDLMRNAILEKLQKHGSLTFEKLGNMLEEQLLKKFDGPVIWYYTAVKLDLEARGIIRRVPNAEPNLIEIAG